MNEDTNSAAKTSSRPVCTLHLSNRAEQRNNIPFVQIRDDAVQPGVPVSSTIVNRKEIVNIGEANSKHGRNQKDHNLFLQDRSFFTGVQQGTGVSQTTSGLCLHPQELSTPLDTQGRKPKTCGGLTAHSSHCYQRVQCSSSNISDNLKREANGNEEPLDILHVSSCNGINTFELVSNNTLSKQRLLESDKSAEAVVSEHRLCDFCTEILSPVCYLASAESQTKHSDFTADLQYNTSFSNLGISRSSKIYSDNSSDETVKYRTNVRKQCKRHHNSKLYTVVKHDASIKNTFVLQDIDNLGFPSYVLTPQGTHSGENKHSGDLHGKTRKHRHRRKYEIGKNLVSENKATTLLVHSSETVDAQRPGPQDKDFSKLLNCKLYLPPPPGSVHKESPRVRFERDRAARNNAISSKSDSSPSNLAVFCIKEQTIVVKERETVKSTASEKSAAVDVNSVLLKSAQLKCLTPIQRSRSENTSLVVNEDTDVSGSQGSAALQLHSLTSNNGLVKAIPELRQTTPNSGTKDQRFLQSTLTNTAGLLDPKKTVVDITLPEKLANCSVLRTNDVYVSAITGEKNSEALTSIEDETPAQVGARVNTHLPLGASVKSHACFWHNSQFVNNNNCVPSTARGVEVVNRNTDSRVNFSSVFYSKENNKREDIITSNNSCKHQLLPGTLPTILTDLCPQVTRADSLSSAHFESSISPAVGHSDRCQNINSSERSDNVPDFRYQSRSEFVHDFNRALSFDSVSDIGVFHQVSARDNSDSVIGNRPNANIKSHYQPRRLASDLCIKHRLPQSEIDEQLEHVRQFVDGLFCEEVKDNHQTRNYKYTANQLQCTQCQIEINKLSVTGEATPKCDSAAADNSFCEFYRANNNTNATHAPASSRDSHQFEHLTENNPFAISISNCSPCAQMNTSGKRMLASRGLRIYDCVGDVNAMLNPDKPIDLQSTCASSFQWEGATYLILPTVLDSLTAISAANTSNGATIGNNELLIHRSVSDSGVTTHPSVTSDASNNLLASDSNRDVNIEDNFSSTSSRNQRLSFKQRSLSVDVLCAGDDSNVGFISMPAESHNTSEDNINAGRGYVEWRTCSTWLRKPDLEINLEKNSQGYVEWDTIWAADQPRMGAGKDDEHLYDSVGNYTSYSSNNNITHRSRKELHSLPVNTETPSRKEFLSVSLATEIPSREELQSLAVTAETPPALPERTYISRLKNCSRAELSPSCLEMPKSNHHHRHHHRHHDISNLRKYHNHCHHNHNSNSKQKQHSSAAPSTFAAPLTRSSKHSTSVFSKQCKHISGSSENGLHPHSSCNDLKDLQNYATVHKLRGYRFNNNATASESPVPNFPNKLHISSENYCHLAPLSSKENMVSLQTSDILDYIDGLHDSMSPKRRENIYILLNNKQTRAKFSESLEIESRLMSRGLISGSSGSEPLEDTLRERRTVCSETTQGMFNFEMPKRKGAIAPVSSTYV